MKTSSVAIVGPEARGLEAFPGERVAVRATGDSATALNFQILLLALLGPGLVHVVGQEQNGMEGVPCFSATEPATGCVDKLGDRVHPQELVVPGSVESGRKRPDEMNGQEMMASEPGLALRGAQGSSPSRVPPRDEVSVGVEERSLPAAPPLPGSTSRHPVEQSSGSSGSPWGETAGVVGAREPLRGGEGIRAEDPPGGKNVAGSVRVRALPDGETAVETTGDVSQLNSAGRSRTGTSGGSGNSPGRDGALLAGGASGTARVRFGVATQDSHGEDWTASGEVRGPAEDGGRSAERRQKMASPELLRVAEGSVAPVEREAPGNDVTRTAGSEGARGLPSARANAPVKAEAKAVEMEIAQPELGKVTVLLTTRGGEVHVRFVSPDGGLREALWEGRQELFHAMSGRGLNLAGFLVDSGWNQAGDSGSPEQRTQRLVFGRHSVVEDVRAERPAGMSEKQGLVDYMV